MPVTNLKVRESLLTCFKFIDHPNIWPEDPNRAMKIYYKKCKFNRNTKVRRKPLPQWCRITSQKGGNLDYTSLKTYVAPCNRIHFWIQEGPFTQEFIDSFGKKQVQYCFHKSLAEVLIFNQIAPSNNVPMFYLTL